MKVAVVIGARPQFIKACAVSKVISNDYPDVEEIIIHTGQHYDSNMSDIFFRDLGIPQPKYNLGINQGRHAELTGRIMNKLEPILENESPDWVLVYGDTDSTLAAALTAAKLHQKVVHVEAGLRSFNKFMPEEINRVVTDHVATLNFCPTANATINLKNEGLSNIMNDGFLVPFDADCQDLTGIANINTPLVINVGDVMYDVLLLFRDIAIQKSTAVEEHKLSDVKYAIATIHREENTANITALTYLTDKIAALSENIPVVMPVHPRTEKFLRQHSKWNNLKESPTIVIVPPLSYLDMIRFMSSASVVITDSGGLQKEAFFLGIPCLTVRAETEWIETVSSGRNLIVGNKPEDLWNSYKTIIAGHNSLSATPAFFGDGRAADRIVQILYQSK